MQNIIKVLLLSLFIMTACATHPELYQTASEQEQKEKELVYELSNFFEKIGYEVISVKSDIQTNIIVCCSMCEVSIMQLNRQTGQLETHSPHGEECPNDGEHAAFPMSQHELDNLSQQLKQLVTLTK